MPCNANFAQNVSAFASPTISHIITRQNNELVGFIGKILCLGNSNHFHNFGLDFSTFASQPAPTLRFDFGFKMFSNDIKTLKQAKMCDGENSGKLVYQVSGGGDIVDLCCCAVFPNARS